jgi:hypothetical protein
LRCLLLDPDGEGTTIPLIAMNGSHHDTVLRPTGL